MALADICSNAMFFVVVESLFVIAPIVGGGVFFVMYMCLFVIVAFPGQ